MDLTQDEIDAKMFKLLKHAETPRTMSMHGKSTNRRTNREMMDNNLKIDSNESRSKLAPHVSVIQPSKFAIRRTPTIECKNSEPSKPTRENSSSPASPISGKNKN